MEVIDNKTRLEFKRRSCSLVNLEKTKYFTRSYQGTFFYCKNDNIYSQRSDIKNKIFIRGKEIPIDDIKNAFLKIKSVFKIIFSENIDFVNYTFVIIYSREDLLITHRYKIPPQIFFLGVLDEDNKFIPGFNFYKKNIQFFFSNNIFPSTNYKENGKNNQNIIDILCSLNSSENTKIEEYWSNVEKNIEYYFLTEIIILIPYLVEPSEELLNEGIVDCTEISPISYYSDIAYSVIDLFSNTQNNIQLFLKIFFVEAKNERDRSLILNDLINYLPFNKEIEFRLLDQKYNNLIKKISQNPGLFNFSKGLTSVILDFSDIDFQIFPNTKDKIESTLMTFNKHLRGFLTKNQYDLSLTINKKIEEAIYQFFIYRYNINNASRILKFSNYIIIK